MEYRDKYFIEFEMLNGKAHSFEIEDTTNDIIYNTILNGSPDGWIQLRRNGDIHYLKEDKIAAVKITSASARKRRSEASLEAARNIRF